MSEVSTPYRLAAHDLACHRGGRTVFSHLSFVAEAGVALIVTGPNGAGKSSLLRLIAGLLDVTEGGLSFEGGAADASLAEQTHYIGHLDALKAAMSVRETLSFWADFLGGTGADVANACAVYDLTKLVDLPVAYLSAGQKRRLSLARLLIAPRPLWLLDEPGVALDAASLARLASAIDAHLSAGGLVVAATHQPLGIASSVTLDLGHTGILANARFGA
ncbi:MAG: heme ABC exporter ATP-binding protein CcmA [Phenylobacterium sp.]|uniref:heme ABC exporter ATP-binding protein CcmA n=1 Tax=Phenylobacterium sp. TaxID=1871053 RepID=UPI002723558E|nr:heme ABC exporter ATP-binding protein CcmA [Phenylobacterium sp.]MDO8411951.1 heme ABC exporter ATP-binding protein CcmA [Phenylobacterium sp.]|tara:strand:+ start:1090 stop:1743 length:654 start_codon:yes stop_codon:yes gene_type:complete